MATDYPDWTRSSAQQQAVTTLYANSEAHTMPYTLPTVDISRAAGLVLTTVWDQTDNDDILGYQLDWELAPSVTRTQIVQCSATGLEHPGRTTEIVNIPRLADNLKITFNDLSTKGSVISVLQAVPYLIPALSAQQAGYPTDGLWNVPAPVSIPGSGSKTLQLPATRGPIHVGGTVSGGGLKATINAAFGFIFGVLLGPMASQAVDAGGFIDLTADVTSTSLQLALEATGTADVTATLAITSGH